MCVWLSLCNMDCYVILFLFLLLCPSINQSIMGGIRRGARCLAYSMAPLLAVTPRESPCRLPLIPSDSQGHNACFPANPPAIYWFSVFTSEYLYALSAVKFYPRDNNAVYLYFLTSMVYCSEWSSLPNLYAFIYLFVISLIYVYS